MKESEYITAMNYWKLTGAIGLLGGLLLSDEDRPKFDSIRKQLSIWQNEESEKLKVEND